MRVVFLDTETGGLDPIRHPIIQLAAIATEGEEILETFERKLALISSTAEILLNIVSNKHSHRLEWYIIGLICLELLLGLFNQVFK